MAFRVAVCFRSVRGASFNTHYEQQLSISTAWSMGIKLRWILNISHVTDYRDHLSRFDRSSSTLNGTKRSANNTQSRVVVFLAFHHDWRDPASEQASEHCFKQHFDHSSSSRAREFPLLVFCPHYGGLPYRTFSKLFSFGCFSFFHLFAITNRSLEVQFLFIIFVY